MVNETMRVIDEDLYLQIVTWEQAKQRVMDEFGLVEIVPEVGP